MREAESASLAGSRPAIQHNVAKATIFLLLWLATLESSLALHGPVGRALQQAAQDDPAQRAALIELHNATFGTKWSIGAGISTPGLNATGWLSEASICR